VFKIASFQEEYNGVKSHFEVDCYIKIERWENSDESLKISIKGLEDTPYEGGNFIFELRGKSEEEKKNQKLNLWNIPISEYKRRKGIPIYVQIKSRGKVLPNNISLSEAGVHPEKDIITLMVVQAGSSDSRFKIPIALVWNQGHIYCKTLIWHPNIDLAISPGKINFCLGEKWAPNASLINLIEGLKSLIHLKSPIFDPYLGLNRKAATQYLDDRVAFERKARIWNKKYAQKGGV